MIYNHWLDRLYLNCKSELFILFVQISLRSTQKIMNIIQFYFISFLDSPEIKLISGKQKNERPILVLSSECHLDSYSQVWKSSNDWSPVSDRGFK